MSASTAAKTANHSTTQGNGIAWPCFSSARWAEGWSREGCIPSSVEELLAALTHPMSPRLFCQSRNGRGNPKVPLLLYCVIHDGFLESLSTYD